MSSPHEGSNDMGRGRANKTHVTRRSWSQNEEEILLAALKKLVVQGWKSDNGFRAGYLNKLEDAMKKEFPGTDLKGMPHINSKLSTWKKNYYSLSQILSRSGVGFNLKGTYMIDCDNDQWDQIVKSDNNARLMRYKSWPFLDDWKEIFGRDRATGESAEDFVEAVNDLLHEENLAGGHVAGDYHVNLEDLFENETTKNSFSQSQKDDQLPRHSGKKRKAVEGLQGVCDLLGEISRNTNARLENLASRIGYEFDLGKARKEVFDLLGNILGLSLEDKFDVCEILAEKVDRLEIFMGLSDSARPTYVMRLLRRKGM